MSMYRVTWVIDLETDSPQEAAEAALRIQRDTDSTATVFHVEQQFGSKGLVTKNFGEFDLSQEE